MTEKTWLITYLDDTPSLEVEAESLVKAVEKVKDKLSYANLKYAYLRGADLRGADLKYANLSYADLSRVDFREADLKEADLSWSDLSRADFKGADLIWADLEVADLKGAKGLPKKIRDADRVQILRQEKGKENANNYRRSDNNMAAD